MISWEHSWLIESIRTLGVLPTPHLICCRTRMSPVISVAVRLMWVRRGGQIQRAPLTGTEQFVRRCVDVVGASSLLLLLSPLMLLTAFLMKLDSHGPALFFQTRNGFNGRAFRIVKFRTMHVLENGDVIRQATRTDPRVTRLGRWLRRTNIDELPQLFNVLHGDMSLIGPRPHAAADNSEYEKLITNYAFG